ncbi:MAG TPA: DUF4082 domain-containing protein, partial [Candidatus Sulfotelmatobacter sp.]|nr:DUF4082 domain-containing protein [Candidatus Sulfotelmatobacter sp.]
LQTTITGPGTVSFWWKVSSESYYDYLTFMQDGVSLNSISGEQGWAFYTVSLASGTHNLRWAYAKNSSISSGQDKAWLDQVTFVPTVGILDHFTWAPIAVTQLFNVPFPVSIQARDAFENLVSNYTGTVNLSAAAGTGAGLSGTILASPAHSSYSSGDYTMGYAFTPNTNLTVTHVRHYFGTKVSIWTESGTLLASQSVVSTPGTWLETALTTPLQLQAGTRYRVAAATSSGNYYYRNDLDYPFAFGTIDQSYYGSGDTFPTTSDSAHWWFVDLRYAVGAAEPVVMAPATAGPFVSGLWSGTATVLQPGTNISLRAADTLGHSGASDVFTVEMPSNTSPLVARQPSSQVIEMGSPASLCASVWGTPPLAYQWFYFGTNLSGATSPCLNWSSTTTNLTGPYFVIVTNAFGAVTSTVATLTVLPVLPLAEGLDTPGWTWTTGGTSNWIVQTATTHDGADAAQSGTISHNQSSWLQTTITGPGTVSFWWKVSSESYYDYLTFMLDGVSQTSISGEQAWALQTYTLGSGPHTLRWAYSKSSSVSSGQDKAWLDQVTFVPTVGILDHFTWAPIGATQLFNVPFPVTIQARDAFENPATNFITTVNLSAALGLGSGVTGTILTNPVHTASSSGTYTLGYAFTPTTNLTVTHVRHYFGTKVSIWTDTGTLLASQDVLSSPGTWTETALTSPLQLQAGTRYRVAAFTSGGNYYYRYDLPMVFSCGTIDQAYEGYGDVFPDTADAVYWWFVDLRYAVGASEPVVMTPGSAGPFTNGQWSGTATVLQPGTNISLRAGDTLGHSGASGTFMVEMPSNTPPLLVRQPASQVIEMGSPASLCASAWGTPPLAYQWLYFGTNLSGATSPCLSWSSSSTNLTGPYVVIVTNAFGAVTSTVATLTVLPVLPLAEGLDTPGWTWTTGGTSNWIVQTATTHDGADAAQSGGISHSQSSWLQTTITGPGTVSFWWKVSSESYYDYLTFTLDGVNQSSISGEQSWALRTYTLGSGPHTLRWTYSKNSSVSSGQDKAWLDQVTFVPTVGILDHFT